MEEQEIVNEVLRGTEDLQDFLRLASVNPNDQTLYINARSEDSEHAKTNAQAHHPTSLERYSAVPFDAQKFLVTENKTSVLYRVGMFTYRCMDLFARRAGEARLNTKIEEHCIGEPSKRGAQIIGGLVVGLSALTVNAVIEHNTGVDLLGSASKIGSSVLRSCS